MRTLEEVFEALRRMPGLAVSRAEPLSRHTRFGVGGPAAIFAEADGAEAAAGAFQAARSGDLPLAVLGEGTNVIAPDDGFPGVVLRFTGGRIARSGARIVAEAGASLWDLVDCAVDSGLEGLETLAGIPGSVGGALYGNAGAYGHSISERVARVSFFDGARRREIDPAGCAFGYRESVFKRRRDGIILEAELVLSPGSPETLRAAADRIVDTRNRKFPERLKCAGSVFKNLLLARLPGAVAAAVPANVVREGKIPAAWFLEQAGAKGRSRGDMRVADYHANLIYNSASGTAGQLRELIAELKVLVQQRFALDLEEEVQYLGFDNE